MGGSETSYVAGRQERSGRYYASDDAPFPDARPDAEGEFECEAESTCGTSAISFHHAWCKSSCRARGRLTVMNHRIACGGLGFSNVAGAVV